MLRRRSQRYYQRPDSEDEFETPAFQAAAENPPVPRQDESDDDLQSESGLGESPEEDLIEEQPSDDDVKGSRPENDNDSDSAPEEVSFAKSRETEEKRQQLIEGAIHKGRIEERERRRKRDELFKLQKKEKLAALKKRKLPEELLAVISQLAEKKQKTDSEKAEAQSLEEEKEEDEEEEDNFSSDEEAEDDDAEEFIPLADTQEKQMTVISLKAHKGQGQGTPFGESVASFKHTVLYGGRHKRVTSQQARQQHAKRQARR